MLSPEKRKESSYRHASLEFISLQPFSIRGVNHSFKDNGFSFGHVPSLLMCRKVAQWSKGRQTDLSHLAKLTKDRPGDQSSFQTPKFRTDTQEANKQKPRSLESHGHPSWVQSGSYPWTQMLWHYSIFTVKCLYPGGRHRMEETNTDKSLSGGQTWDWILSDWMTQSSRLNGAPKPGPQLPAMWAWAKSCTSRLPPFSLL